MFTAGILSRNAAILEAARIAAGTLVAEMTPFLIVVADVVVEA